MKNGTVAHGFWEAVDLPRHAICHVAHVVHSLVTPLTASKTVVEDMPIQGLPEIKWAGPTKAHRTMTGRPT